ncbi:MAG TPA: Gfo/Idh/MocA family oxidoreductase, partial [Verrucomicrobiae bacterium]
MKTPEARPKVTRRQFLALAGAAVALPTIMPRSVFSANAPSNRITLGAIGCGNMGTSNLRAFLRQKDCQVVAACDVDKQHLTQAVNLINRQYQNKDCKRHNDFRELLARADIDAVMMATPDHWHGVVAVEAARHKKDIYGEKPLARTIAEQQAIVRAVHENGRIWQTGSWQRSQA